MPVLELETTQQEQVKKIEEEYMEFIESVVKNDKMNIVFECLDLIQACFGFLSIYCGFCILPWFFKKHYRKLQTRGWRIDDELHIQLKHRGEQSES